MAIKKRIATEYGVDAEYHRIASMQVYYADSLADVTVETFATEAARRAKSAPLAARTIRVSFSGEPTRADMYAAIKKHDFAGGEDA